MKGRAQCKGPPSADLLVCFPSRGRLSLMPKPICSPARLPDSSTRRPSHHHHHLRKSTNRGGHGSPSLWAKTKNNNNNNNSDVSEPTSPKVTCAGQIKVRTKPSSCKNWQSVMEEIERMHNSRKVKKKGSWIEALGFKKDVMQFLTCLRNLRFDFGCFGAIPTSVITSDDEEDDDEDDEDESTIYRDNSAISRDTDDNQESRAVFSKWFMILQEDNNHLSKEMMIRGGESSKRKVIRPYYDVDVDVDVDDDEQLSPVAEVAAPPPNALLLMRCRSAPAKSWLEEREEEEEEDGESEEEDEALKRSSTDYLSRFASEITKEIGVEEIDEKISRTKSWKR